jgi:transcriptional regulator with XRE-family HTH domain
MDAGNWATLLKETLPGEIAKLRKDRGLSKNELAARTGLARSFVTEIEQGKTTPSVESLARIAFVLGISPGSLLKKAEKQLSSIPKFKREGK